MDQENKPSDIFPRLEEQKSFSLPDIDTGAVTWATKQFELNPADTGELISHRRRESVLAYSIDFHNNLVAANPNFHSIYTLLDDKQRHGFALAIGLYDNSTNGDLNIRLRSVDSGRISDIEQLFISVLNNKTTKERIEFMESYDQGPDFKEIPSLWKESQPILGKTLVDMANTYRKKTEGMEMLNGAKLATEMLRIHHLKLLGK
ncbi:hypothetical protein HGA88_01940 [Candidatus Roizmanbacteria bacterium]|nr:hypothetical protein [Candidatus Roizmanbacteria bacterium]